MSSRLPFLAAALLLAAPLLAADPVSFVTRDGQSFHGVTVKGVKGRRLEVATPAGVKSLRFTNLPREIQERFFHPSMLYPPQIGDTLDFTTSDGVRHQGPLRAVTPIGISMETSVGIETLPFAKLPPELANTFDYDPEDAARYEAALRAQRAQALAAQQAAEKKAAAEKAARDRAEAAKKKAHGQPARGPQMGDRGARNLGTPQLGGSGLDR